MSSTVIPILNFGPAYAELFLTIAVSMVLLVDMFVTDARRIVTYVLTLVSIGVCALITLSDMISGGTAYSFHNMFVSDPMADVLKLATYIAVAVTLVYSRDYVANRGIVSGERGGEFYPMTLFALLGQMVMISANNFLVIYLGLELMSLSLYAMIALRRDSAVSIEAAMKYFVLGALASGFLLYGMSMVYGATGSLDLTRIATELTHGGPSHAIMVFGIVFIVAGLAFKLGVVPFHMWVPDVYEGAPTAVTLMLGGAPKLAAFAITLRLLVEALMTSAADWQQMLVILAVLSLALGNITAIAQSSMKRLLAYSTISHMGFVLLGLLSGVVGGDAHPAAAAYSSAMFYVITYVLTSLGAFGVLLYLSRGGFDADQLDDFKGLFKRSPWAALLMMIFMLSLAGIPPTVGFYAKFAVISSVVVAGMGWLAVFAVMMSLIAAFYYLRVVKLMFFDEPLASSPIDGAMDFHVVLVANGLAVLVLGLLPDGLLQSCLVAITRTLAT